ncbi:hypothetical protein [Salinigranum sp.]|uniref:hypothetical protein n=1 Tax=Salinigranum sp. TaxID=1966351 RepID=UPI00356A8846
MIPETVVLSGLLLPVVQSGQASPEGDLAGITLGLVLSFVIGRLLQTVAPAVTFVVEWVERVPGVPRLGPVSMKRELERLHAADDRIRLEEGFWNRCTERFGFPDRWSTEDEYEDLWRSLLTYLEATPYSQTVRMRALSAMTRGLWTGFGTLAVVYLGVALLPFSALGALTHPALRYEAAAAGALALAFWVSNREFKRLWLRYVIVDFYLYQTAPRARPESR